MSFVEILDILVWTASFGIPVSYIIQIKHNYEHRETRDFNIYSLMVADYAYLVYGIKSGMLEQTAFIAKYGLSFALCSLMIAQIIKYRKEGNEWHNDVNKYCSGQVKGKLVCGNELEPRWDYCPDCGSKVI